nr:9132_t:CDS:2 [Entrophospora candida]
MFLMHSNNNQIEKLLRRQLSNSKCNKETIKSAESKRKTIGSNEYKNNPTSNKCPFLKINSISPTHDSTIVNLCISTAFVTRVGLGLEFDGLYSADYSQIEETSKNLNTTPTTLFTKKNFIKRIAAIAVIGMALYESFKWKLLWLLRYLGCPFEGLFYFCSVANKKSAITTFWLSATYFENNKKGIRPIGHNVMEIDKALNDDDVKTI